MFARGTNVVIKNNKKLRSLQILSTLYYELDLLKYSYNTLFSVF